MLTSVFSVFNNLIHFFHCSVSQELLCMYVFINLYICFCLFVLFLFFFFCLELELHYSSDLDLPRSGACSLDVDWVQRLISFSVGEEVCSAPFLWLYLSLSEVARGRSALCVRTCVSLCSMLLCAVLCVLWWGVQRGGVVAMRMVWAVTRLLCAIQSQKQLLKEACLLFVFFFSSVYLFLYFYIYFQL